MWPFNSKTKITVATSVSRMIPDELLPNAVQAAAIKSVLNEGDFVQDQLQGMVDGIPTRVQRAYNYGKGSYSFGLPTGGLNENSKGGDIIQNILNTLEGTPVVMEYHFYGNPNILHISWLKLVANYGYVAETNELTVLSAQKGWPVYLHDMVVTLPGNGSGYQPDVIAQFGTPPNAGPSPYRPAHLLSPGLADVMIPSLVATDPTATEDYAKVTVAWETVVLTGNISVRTKYQETFNIYNGEYNDTRGYFQVKYSTATQTKFWIYALGTGTYPALDTVFNVPSPQGDFFPWVHFRKNKQSMGANITSTGYKHSKKMAGIYGLDYDSIHESIETSPDIADVEDSWMMMGVPAVTTDPLEIRYLYDFFDELSTQFPTRQLSPLNLSNPRDSWVYDASNLWALNIKDTEVNMSLLTSGVYKQRRAGSIGPVGTYTSSFERIASQQFVNITVPRHVYRKQVTTGIYFEIHVLNLSMQYEVLQGHSFLGDEDDGILLIPIDRSVTAGYSYQDRERLFARSMHLVFNSAIVTKIKWYQQEWFATFLKIAAVVAIVYGAYEAAAELWAAGATVTAIVIATIQVILTRIIEGIVISYIFQVFAQAVGVELALFLAVIAAVYGVMDAFENGSLTSLPPLAKDLLYIANNLVKGTTAVIMDAMKDIQKEFEALAAAQKETTKLIEDAQELLENSTVLKPGVIFGEAPDAFFQRTVHAGNIGTIGYEAVSSYVATALTLPTISQTLQGANDGLV